MVVTMSMFILRILLTLGGLLFWLYPSGWAQASHNIHPLPFVIGQSAGTNAFPWAAFLIGIIVIKGLSLVVLLYLLRKRRIAERGLRRQIDRMELAAASADAGTWCWDLGDRERPAWTSRGARKVLGIHADESRPNSIHPNNIHPDDCAAVERAWKSTRQNAEELDIDFRVVLPDGEIRWISEKGRLSLPPNENHPGCIAGVVIDVTRKKNLEHQNELLRNNLLRIDRLNLLTEVTASLSHQINQPLGAIVNSARAGNRFLAAGDIEPLRDILSDIASYALRASDVVQGVRQLAARGDAPRQEVDLNHAVAAVQHLTAHDARMHRCVVTTELARTPVIISASPQSIQQALLNMVTNGMEAMADTPDDKRRIVIKTDISAEGFAEVSVRDFGCGIPADAQPHLFQKFFTTKPDGIGIGLSIAQSVIKAHDGRLEMIEMSPGTCFRFLVPVLRT